MFLPKVLRRVEVFLEQADEVVAQASRRIAVEGATSTVDSADELSSSEDDVSTRRRASNIPRAEERAASQPSQSPFSEELDIPQQSESGADPFPELDAEDAWGAEVSIDESKFTEPREEDTHAYFPTGGSEKGDATDSVDSNVALQGLPEHAVDSTRAEANVAAEVSAGLEAETADDTSPSESEQIPMMLEPMDAMFAAPAPRPPAPPVAKRRFAPSSAKKPPTGAASLTAAEGEYVRALKAESADLRKELELVEGDFEKSRRERSKLVKNLKRMKEIVHEMDESLREKSSEARSLEAELVAAKDEISSLRTKTRESDARGKDGMDLLRKELTAEIEALEHELDAASKDAESLQEENERLKEALLHGNEVDMATADGARQEASQAHHAYEAESQAHRETRKQAKEREEALESEAVLAANALGVAQRKTEESMIAASHAKASQRAAETKLSTVTKARDAAFARVEDLQRALSLYERGEGNEAPGQKEAKEMRETVSELENALEAKNVELNRLEGEAESLRASLKARRDPLSPRTKPLSSGPESATHEAVEIKLRHMADSALRKQAQLEVLRSENRALQHQLTTERKRTREAQAMAAAASSSGQSIRGGFRGILDTGAEVGERVYGVRDGPLARFRTPRNWPKWISRIITGMDQFSAQALAFLRKEPLLRIAIIIYIMAIHIFVYSLLHWHVDAVSGAADITHERIATAKGGKVGLDRT